MSTFVKWKIWPLVKRVEHGFYFGRNHFPTALLRISPVFLKFNQMLRRGKSQSKAAQFFGVSESAICKAKAELQASVVKNVALESAHKVVDQNLDAVAQLQKINDVANNLLDELEQTPELKLKIMAEIRGQLRLQLDIFQTLYDMKAI